MKVYRIKLHYGRKVHYGIHDVIWLTYCGLGNLRAEIRQDDVTCRTCLRRHDKQQGGRQNEAT